MAEKETGLNIPVSAYADKDSAKEAVSELSKGVLSSLKDGYIEIPAEIKVPIKNASKDLQKAQKDVIKQWDKTFKEGFSSSAQDLDNLTEAYRRFKTLAAKEHKAGTKQYRGISSLMGEQIQSYNTQKQAREQKRAEQRANLEDAKVRRNNKRTTARIERENKKNERINNRYIENLTQGASRAKASSHGAPTNLGTRRPSMEGLAVTTESILASEISPYRRTDQKTLMKNIKEELKKTLASTTTKRMMVDDYSVFEGNEKSRTSKEDRDKFIQNKDLYDLAKIQGGLIKGRSDVVSDDLINQVALIISRSINRIREMSSKATPNDYDEYVSKQLEKTYQSIGTMLDNRFSDDSKRRIGSTSGEEKGSGPYLKEVNEIKKEIFKVLDRIWDTLQSSVRRTTSPNPIGIDRSLYRQTKRETEMSDTYQQMRQALSPVVDALQNSRRLDMIENSRESASDSKALEVAQTDASTGLNTEGSAQELFSHLETGNRINDQTQGLIEEISKNSVDGYVSTDGTKRKGSKKTINNWPSILQTINKNIATISKNVSKLATGKGGGGKGSSKQTKTNQEVVRNLPDLFRTWNGNKWGPTGVIDRTSEDTRRRIKLPDQSQWEQARYRRAINAVEEERQQIERGEHPSQQRTNRMSQLNIYSSQPGFFGKLEQIIKKALPMSEVDRIMNASADEQARMRAERMNTFGLNNGRQLSDTGDIASIRRTKEVFGWIYKRDKDNRELFQDIRLTPGMGELDTTSIMKALNKVLSGPEMFRAQTGGILRNVIGMMTGYIGMPSIEKTRSQAEGLNQVMADVRNEVLALIQAIKTDESTLRGMEQEGTVAFDSEGRMTRGTSAARKTFADMEERKGTLKAALAEVSMIDQVVAKTGGRIPKIIKQIGFVMPELMQSNTILQNLNAGLDKNGKALKFQSRFAENLNYVFQLMARHIGQVLKNWLLMLNPLYQVKKLFDDFASYDPKWQRTMNVIKYNLRDIVRPIMEWIAQTLVNIIGFLDIISMKIQEAFGYTPISLFDQDNANDMKNTYEKIANISAGFDELHDVGSSSSENDPNDLLGEIYKPQLSQAWKDLANEIGDLFAGIITGDLGFGDVMKKILEIAWKGIQQIWEWFKNTEVGQWLIKNWGKILATMLAAFLAWKLLKIGGSVLVKALFGGLVSGAKTVFSTIGTALVNFMKMPNLSDLNLWGAMTSAEKFAVVLKGLVGISMTVASAIMGINTAYDSTHNEKELTETEKAFNSVKSVVSDVGVGLGLFIATGNPVIALIGVLINELVKTGVEFFTTKNAIGDATEELEEWQSACEEAESAQESYREGLQQLREKEEAYGMSAENVYNLVESGKVKYEDLTAAQMDLYNSYAKVSELQNTSVQASQKATEEGLDREIAKVKENQENWQECYSKIEEAYQQGNISFAQYVDSCEELNSVLDSDNQRLFQENIPEYLEEAWNPSHYESSFQNLENAWGNICTYFNQHPLEALFDIVLSPIAKTIIGALAGFAIGGPLGAIIGGIGGAIWGVSSAINKSNSYVNDVSTYTVGEEIDEDYLKKRGRSYDIGTNYVPSDGLAYLHQGEAVIPKKYNQPYQPVMSSADQATMYQMMSTLRSLDTTMKQGISVNGQFVQRGSDLVAVVNRTNSRTGADLLSNVAYAR